MRKYDTVLFDLDGTLTDSGPGITRCVAVAFEQLGYEVPEYEQLRTFVGPPLVSSFSSFGMDHDTVEKAIEIFRANYAAGGKFENRVYDGIPQLLNRLRDQGMHLYVATSKPEPLAREVLAHFGLDGYFDEICGASTDHSRETKEAVISYLLEKVHAENAVMVGDTDYDVIGAHHHGIPCIGVSWGFGNKKSMQEAGAIAIASDMDSLYQLLTEE